MLLQMHQGLRLHQMHQAVRREKKKYSFFSFFYGKHSGGGLVQIGHVVTNAPNVTVAPFAPKPRKFDSVLYF
jgi:hypothetical protein